MGTIRYTLEGKPMPLPKMYAIIMAEDPTADIVSQSTFFHRTKIAGLRDFTNESLRQILSKDYEYTNKKEFTYNGEITSVKEIYRIFKKKMENSHRPICSYPTFHRKIYSAEIKNITDEHIDLMVPNYNMRNKVPKKGVREKEAMTAQGIKFWCDTAKLW